MLVIVGLIWLLGETSTIVMPVILATVLGAVAGPAVGWLERRRVPRVAGAVLVLLGLVAIGVLIFCLVFGGISAQSGDISAKLNQSLDKIQGWLGDVGVDNAQNAKEGAQEAAPEIRTTLLSGVAAGIDGLKSLVFFLAFSTLSTLFVLKDGPVMHRFINRHMGVPEPVANVVTTNIAKSLHRACAGGWSTGHATDPNCVPYRRRVAVDRARRGVFHRSRCQGRVVAPPPSTRRATGKEAENACAAEQVCRSRRGAHRRHGQTVRGGGAVA